jgi:hypothetical protein
MDKWMCIVIDAALFMSAEGFDSPLLRRPDWVRFFRFVLDGKTKILPNRPGLVRPFKALLRRQATKANFVSWKPILGSFAGFAFLHCVFFGRFERPGWFLRWGLRRVKLAAWYFETQSALLSNCISN